MGYFPSHLEIEESKWDKISCLFPTFSDLEELKGNVNAREKENKLTSNGNFYSKLLGLEASS